MFFSHTYHTTYHIIPSLSCMMMPTNTHCCRLTFSLLFFFHPIYYLRPSFSLPPSGNSDRGSHSRLFSPPTHYGSCLAFFIARRFQLFLPSSTRVELCLPTLGALNYVDPFLFLQISSKSRHGGIRTHGPTLLIVLVVLIVAFEGYHY